MALISLLLHMFVVKTTKAAHLWLHLTRQLLNLDNSLLVLLVQKVQMRDITVLRLEVEHVQSVIGFDT